MFENIAMRFEHDNPDAPVPELEAFLKKKAKEWKGLKARLAALEAGNARLANVRAEAEAALERGDFDAARALLDGAAEIGTDAGGRGAAQGGGNPLTDGGDLVVAGRRRRGGGEFRDWSHAVCRG